MTLSLCAYLAAAIGVPLPAARARKDTSQPFPCMDHSCGCQDAEQCRLHCCCLTPEQRQTWARSRQPRVSADEEQPAATSWRTAPRREQSEGQPEAARAHSCCHSPPDQPGSDSPSPEPDPRWTQILSALGCQGHQIGWLVTGAALLPILPAPWNPWPEPVAWLGTRADSPISLTLSPPAPPPRCGHPS